MRMLLSCGLSTLALVAVCCCPAQAGDPKPVQLKVGQAAPEFTVKTDAGETWNSADHVGKKLVVVYFYPAAMTGGCTKQACGFRDDMDALRAKGVEVVGVSGDQPEGLALFKKVHGLNFTLLADTNGAVARKFGVPLRDGGEISREVDGQEHILKRGVTASRWTFLIDRQGKIALKNEKVNAAGDSKAILTAVEKLGSSE